MLGSISQLLDFDEHAEVTDTNKIQPHSLFRLLVALEQTSVDAVRDDYSILELVKDDSSSSKIASIITPTTMPVANLTVVAALGQGNMIAPTTIKTLDFCYADDDTIFTVVNCIDVCVTVGKSSSTFSAIFLSLNLIGSTIISLIPSFKHRIIV